MKILRIIKRDFHSEADLKKNCTLQLKDPER